MADKTIDQLPVSTGLDDNSLLVVQQDGQANSITGALIKSFVREAAASSVQEAANSAKDAKASQEVAENARVQADAAKAEAKQSALNASSSADEAERARLAIENLGVSSTTLAAGSQATVSKRTDWEGKVTLSFGIPKGPQGPQGATGPQGISITSIKRTAGNGAAGTTDTYTITLSNGQESTFQVKNGADGKGVGDMLKRVYDPQNKAQDVFAYVDRKVGDIPTPDVSVQISAHNTSSTAHQDIRTALNGKAPATHTHTPASIGAAPAAHTHTAESIGALKVLDISEDFLDYYEYLRNVNSPGVYNLGHLANWMDSPEGEDGGGFYGSLIVCSAFGSLVQIIFVTSSDRNYMAYRFIGSMGSLWNELSTVGHSHTLASLGAAPAYTYGTTDLTAGTSTLANGTLYFQYE